MYVSMSKTKEGLTLSTAVDTDSLGRGCEIFLLWPFVHSWLCWIDFGSCGNFIMVASRYKKSQLYIFRVQQSHL